MTLTNTNLFKNTSKPPLYIQTLNVPFLIWQISPPPNLPVLWTLLRTKRLDASAAAPCSSAPPSPTSRRPRRAFRSKGPGCNWCWRLWPLAGPGSPVDGTVTEADAATGRNRGGGTKRARTSRLAAETGGARVDGISWIYLLRGFNRL